MEIFKEFICESAHLLPNVPEGHKCGRLHGHSFSIEIWIKGPVDSASGWIMDFGDVKNVFQPIYDELDHQSDKRKSCCLDLGETTRFASIAEQGSRSRDLQFRVRL